MTMLRRYWFPLSVVLLLAVIAVNLYALNARRAGEEAEAKQPNEQHAHLKSLPKSDAPANQGHDHLKKEKTSPEEKNDHAGHGMMDHHGMMGKGMMDHKGMMGKGMMHGNMADMMDIRFLLFNHEKIKRSVRRLPNGVETVTSSDDDAVAEKIQLHVKAMYERLQKKQVIRPMDPLFAALFENADKIELEFTNLPDGILVKETSKDPYAVKLIHAHADAVNRFVKEGMSAMMKTTPAPEREKPVELKK